jgi:3-hydroxyacyl-[acyl-carrier-protein] dehydratase
MTEEAAEMDIFEVLKYLPQRYPVLMIDRVKECEPGKRVVALKNVSANEPYFQGHFPGRPIMPGVLILEAMAQAAGMLVLSAESSGGSGGKQHENVYYYVGIDNARFKKPVIPGDQLEIEVKLERALRGIGKFACVASVSGEVVAEAAILLTVRPAGA